MEKAGIGRMMALHSFPRPDYNNALKAWNSGQGDIIHEKDLRFGATARLVMLPYESHGY